MQNLTEHEQHRRFVLQMVQPGLAGLMDGSVSTLAPLFAAAFATRDVTAFERLLKGNARPAVDLGFWTEAAVLAASGIDAVVLGPGDIAQAHGPGEWVSVSELEEARALFRSIF